MFKVFRKTFGWIAALAILFILGGAGGCIGPEPTVISPTETPKESPMEAPAAASKPQEPEEPKKEPALENPTPSPPPVPPQPRIIEKALPETPVIERVLSQPQVVEEALPKLQTVQKPALPAPAKIEKAAPKEFKLLNPAVPEDAKMIQARLAERGFYEGAIDGIWGKGSRAGIKSFKEKHSLKDPDRWDKETQMLLFRGTNQ